MVTTSALAKGFAGRIGWMTNPLDVQPHNSALQARFRRVLRHRGPKKAVVALAHALLWIVYHVLADGTVYRDLGGD